MADHRTLKLSFEGGLLDSQEDAVRPAGYADELTNWMPEPFGGVRARVGWVKPQQTGAPSNCRARGIAAFTRLTDPTLVQWKHASVVGAGPLSLTWDLPPTPGNLLVFVAAYTCEATNFVTTQPAGYNAALFKEDEGNHISNIRYRYATSDETAAISTALNTGGTISMWILEYTGIASATPLDLSTADWSNTTPVTVSGAVAQASEVCIGLAFSNDVSKPPTNTTGFRLIDTFDENAAYDMNAGLWDLITRTGGTKTFTVTYSGAVDSQSALVSFKGWNVAASPEESVQRLVVANSDSLGGSHDIFAAPLVDMSPWTEIDSIVNSSYDSPVAFAAGLQRLWYVSPGWTSGRSFDGAVAQAVIQVPPARTIAFHNERLWVGGVPFNPTGLYYCEVGDATNWPSANLVYIGRDDGEPILDLCPFQGGLLIAKLNSIWYLTGNSKSTFSLVKLEKGGGAPGRCICATPYGAIIAADGQVWQWTGTGLELISRAIERKYTLTDGVVNTLFHDNVLYVVPQDVIDSFAFNFESGAWWSEHLPSLSRLGPMLGSGKRMYSALPNATDTLLIYRDIPKTARDKDYDTLSEWFLAETSEIWPVGPDRRITPLHLHVRVKQRGGNPTHTGITIRPYYDGLTDDGWVQYLEPREVGTFRERFDVGFAEGINSVKFRFEQIIPSGETSVMDIDEVRLDVNVEKRA